MKKNIAIVAGGDSSEVVVSLKSAEGIYSYMDKDRYQVYVITIVGKGWIVEISENEKIVVDKGDFSFIHDGKKIIFDFAYITIHGTPGENGILQAYFELMKIPYSTCNVLISALTFNKFMCNQYLKGFGVKSAESVLLRSGQTITHQEIADKIGFPCFIKSNVGGSSFGVTKVKKAEDVQPAIQKAFSEGGEVLVESFIDGMELTCGMYKSGDNPVVFPVTEVVSQNEFFDFDAKYNGQVEEITPARISDALRDRVQQLTMAIYDILGCKGIVRIDYIITNNDVINLLEVNTTPGMTTTSFIPQQVRAAGMSMTDVITDIIETELKSCLTV